jgi:diguanylate cyclase
VITPEDVDLEVLRSIANKTMFCQDIRRRIAEWNRGGEPFSVILLSIDNRDALVRKYGDSIGKLLLTVVAQSSDTGIRDRDVMAHYSSDTIGIILPKTPLHQAQQVGARLRSALAQTAVLLDGDELCFSLTLGIVAIEDGDDMAKLVERARTQLARDMQQAERRGGQQPVPQPV